MFNPFKNTKGESMIETIIALSILAIGITVAGSITSGSLRNMENARNRIVAINLAREGIEAVRNIRDTNWLKYSSNRRKCWNYTPSGVPCPRTPDPDDLIAPGDYISYIDDQNRWRLIPHEVEPQGNSFTKDNSLLFLVDINADGETDIYNHTKQSSLVYSQDSLTPTDALGEASAEATSFKRLIKIEYLYNNGDILSQNSSGDLVKTLPDGSNPIIDNSYFTNDHLSLNRMRVSSTVRWIRGQNEFKTELKTHLTDYLDRSNLGN